MRTVILMRIIIFVLLTLSTIVSAQDSDFDTTQFLAYRGDFDAQFDLGVMYDSGLGVPENGAEAIKWFRLAAAQGSLRAQIELGAKYYSGLGVTQDAAEAVKWFRLAAEQGAPGAQYMLGIMYNNGEGVPENYLTAYVWSSVSAAQGNQNAKSNTDIIKNRLTNEQLAQGQTLASTCFESNFKDCP